MTAPCPTHLKAARKLVEQGWTQGTNARDTQGYSVRTTSSGAVCFCLIGALLRAQSDTHGSNKMTLQSSRYLRKALNHTVGYLSDWNDHPERTQAEVLTTLDKAITLAEADTEATA